MNQTTVTAVTAGGAFGAIVVWAITAISGADISAPVGAAFGTLGSFSFGLIFPRS